MKIVSIIIAVLFVNLNVSAQVLLKLYNDSLFGYSYGGGDEFTAPKLNENYWSNGLPWSRVLMEQDLAFSPKNVTQLQGMVNFVAKTEDSIYVLRSSEIDSNFIKQKKIIIKNNTFQTKYSVGCIVSQQKFHYGLYELRFKVEEGRGVWPAFWFYGGNANEEIDCFELKGEKNDKIHVDTHCPTGCDGNYKNKLGLNTNWGGWMPVSNYLHNGFNIMQFEWNPESLIWYLNGYPLAYFKGRFPNPMQLYLNTSVAKNGAAFPPGPDKTTKWPNTYSVDYFRAWKPVAAAQELVLKINTELNSSSQFISDYKNHPKKKHGINYSQKKFSKPDGMISLFLLPNNKLKVLILGEVNDKKAIVSIKGINSGQTFNLKTIENEQEIDLIPADKLIQFTLKIKDKEYSRIITIK